MERQARPHEVGRGESVERSYGIAPPAFSLPDATHVGGVRLQVSDLARSVAYYEQVIGLRVLAAGDTTTLGAHGDDRPLVTLETRPGVTPARRGAFGLYHFAILLPDRAALGRFAEHLADRGERVGAANHRVSESLYLWDPDGLGIEVYADRPRSSWQRNGRELVMATERLDITDVIAAGGGIAWAGAPAGTTMGHVHLSVGTLDAAERFRSVRTAGWYLHRCAFLPPEGGSYRVSDYLDYPSGPQRMPIRLLFDSTIVRKS